jgi:CheY-like chemotaxis protein
MDSPLKVLLVEDSKDDCFFFERAFRRSGVVGQLFIAEDGFEAMQFLGQQGRFASPAEAPRPDVIFLDLKMPGANGFDVLRWIQKRSLTTRVVVLSGSQELHDQEAAFQLGAEAYLVKPVTPEQIADILAASSKSPQSQSQP